MLDCRLPWLGRAEQDTPATTLSAGFQDLRIAETCAALQAFQPARRSAGEANFAAGSGTRTKSSWETAWQPAEQPALRRDVLGKLFLLGVDEGGPPSRPAAGFTELAAQQRAQLCSTARMAAKLVPYPLAEVAAYSKVLVLTMNNSENTANL